MSTTLAPPRNISPLIRAGRWAFLLGGIYYGYTHLQTLKAYDAPIRQAKIDEATRKHNADTAAKIVNDKEAMKALAESIGIKPKA